MHVTGPSVSVEPTADGEYNLKIGTESFELNVSASAAELGRLGDVRAAPWTAGALRIGTVAGVPAWWCVSDPEEEAQTLSILVGSDDETWDVGVHLPRSALDDIVARVHDAL